MSALGRRLHGVREAGVGDPVFVDAEGEWTLSWNFFIRKYMFIAVIFSAMFTTIKMPGNEGQTHRTRVEAAPADPGKAELLVSPSRAAHAV